MFEIISQTYASMNGITNPSVLDRMGGVAYDFLKSSEIAPEWSQKLVIDMISDTFKVPNCKAANFEIIELLKRISSRSKIEDIFIFMNTNTIYIHKNKVCWIMHDLQDKKVMVSYGIYNLNHVAIGSVSPNEDFTNRMSIFENQKEILTFSADNLLRIVYTQKNGYTNIVDF